MGLSTVVIVGDDTWGVYCDGYDGFQCFEDIKKVVPDAELKGRLLTSIIVDLGRGHWSMDVIESTARFDYMHEVIEGAACRITQVDVAKIRNDLKEARKEMAWQEKLNAGPVVGNDR